MGTLSPKKGVIVRARRRRHSRQIHIQKDLETAEKYGVRKTPTTLVYANGEQTAEFIGIIDRNDLESAIESATQQSSGFAQCLVDVVRG
ncbi:thioredoxin (plasmid) [Natronorubrum aibiense]|uniref:Thioredoxin n=1 Tax=Natronorubrum aibiense TaxID=348826 RepID=A0A5P9P8L4_9EURY|nr:thioredoxin [Natronorubrum aibiense]